MGLDYDYRIYIKKERLNRALQFIYEHSEKERASFEIINDELYQIRRYANGEMSKTLLQNLGINQSIDTCILVDEDRAIIEYYLFDLTQNYTPDSVDESDFIDL